MFRFCDVAVPVPLDTVFTYRLPDSACPTPGSRVLVPFGRQRLIGIVTELHDRVPRVTAKSILQFPDDPVMPALTPELLRLGKWISDYYLAPVGEVFRTMLPLNAEFRKSVMYRITDEGRFALHLAGSAGSSARSRKTPEDQYAEFRVLEYLSGRERAREETLKSTARTSRAVIEGMVRKKWISREDVSQSVKATRTQRFAVLKSPEGKLNANQRTIVETIAAGGGRLPVQDLAGLAIPKSTLGTLVRRGLIELVEESLEFAKPTLAARASWLQEDFTAAQLAALQRIHAAADARKFNGILMHGVTGSGKTAVYLGR